MINTMKELDEIDVYLCDNKPPNTLVVMDSESAEKYHLTITDLGGAWSPNVTQKSGYPRLVSYKYFDLDAILKRHKRPLTKREITLSEVYTVGRSIQELVQLGNP